MERGASDAALVQALRDGDEDAFRQLIDEHGSFLLRVAMGYVRSRATAEEVLQDTWVGVITGIDGFEGRSSLRTWIVRILSNMAKTRAIQERRAAPFSSLVSNESDATAAVVDPDRFLPQGHGREPGHWALAPKRWETPEEGLLSGEIRGLLLGAIEALPASQRVVITLRDIEGWPAEEVCDALDLTEGNQRVLLHRGRTKVRAELENYFAAAEQDGSPEAVARSRDASPEPHAV